jgi:hypothetical protein
MRIVAFWLDRILDLNGVAGLDECDDDKVSISIMIFCF